jgi:hypothetical protein
MRVLSPILAVVCAARCLTAVAVEPVKTIDVYVTPYYQAADTPGAAPKVTVAKPFDTLLASTRREDVVRARDEIARNNAMLTPMTLMVLAIRLYDVGLRDDSVFWFYAAKDRFVTLAGVADLRSREVAPAENAVTNFAVLAGPVINGYAFCNPDKQQAIRRKAMEWVIANPYRAMFFPQIPARPGDRQANLKLAIAEIRTAVAKERDYLAKPANLAELAARRKENNADAKYCWK